MARIRKTTPEEKARQEANQRRLEELRERRCEEERVAAREQPKPPAANR
jgi:hypothetical protein